MRSPDFTPESPGRLVEIPPGVPAFVPEPMPDELALDHLAVRLLSDAEHAVGRLVGAVRRTVNPFLIGSPLLHREAILSSRIEGTITTPEQLVLAELAGVSEPGEDVGDAEEVLNYMRAMRHGLRSKLPISLRLIRELHGVLMRGVRGGQDRPGEFRDVQNFIGSPGASIGDARFVPRLEWVRFFLKGVEESASESLEQTDTLLALRERYHDQFRSARSFGVLQQLIDNLFASPSTTITMTAQALKITAAAASANIRKLTEGGVLREVTGRKRDQVFVAHEILRFMGKR